MDSKTHMCCGGDHQHPAPADDKVKDPVCGMKIDPASAAGQIEREGQTYYFCSEHCLANFRSDPARYTASGA